MNAALRIALALLLAGPACAQTPAAEMPPLADARPLTLPPLHQWQLPNGLRVVLATRTQLPLVSATLLVLTGPEADPAGSAGLAATTATLLGKGALRGGKPVGAGELARQAEALGGTLDIASSWRASTLGMTVTTPQLPAALALLSDVLRRPLLAADELARVRAQSLGDLRIALNDPGALAELAARRAFWSGSRYAATPTAASLTRLTRAQVTAFHRRWFRPDNSVLVLAGALDRAQAEALAAAAFGDWPLPDGPLPPLPPVNDKANPAHQVLIDMPGSGQTSVLLALPFAALDAPAWPVAQVANAVLGLGYSARLNQQVRIRRGLSYDVSSSLDTFSDASWLGARGQTDHRNAAMVLALLRSEFAAMASDAPAADELRARQATLIGGFARRLETVGGLNALLVEQLVQRRPLQALQAYVDEVSAVTPQQVRDFAAARWPAAAQRAVIVGDGRAIGAAGADWGDGPTLRVPARALDLSRSALVKAPR